MRLHLFPPGIALLAVLAAACGGGYGAAPTPTPAPATIPTRPPAAPAGGATVATRQPAPTATSAPAAAPTSSPAAAPAAASAPTRAPVAAATATPATTPSGGMPAAGAGDYDHGYADTATPSAPTAPTGAHDIEITLQERSASASGMAHAGQVKLAIKNQGRFPHSLAISVGDQTRQLGSNIAPGGTGELTLELAAGEYTFWCPLPGHRQQGIEGRLRVM